MPYYIIQTTTRTFIYRQVKTESSFSVNDFSGSSKIYLALNLSSDIRFYILLNRITLIEC